MMDDADSGTMHRATSFSKPARAAGASSISGAAMATSSTATLSSSRPSIGLSYGYPSASAASSLSSTSSTPAADGVPKCITLFLVPAASAGNVLGCSRGLTSRVGCSMLRCTACDFEVLRFEDVRWSPEADYMFFRNHVPSRPKLSTLAIPARGCAAYCCQCSWVTISPEDGPVCIRKSSGLSVPLPMPGAASTAAAGGGGGGGLASARAMGTAAAGDGDASASGLWTRVGGAGWTCWTCRGEHA